MSVDVIGFDHIYLAVSSLERARAFYELVLGRVLGFRQNEFQIDGAPHVQFFNRHFGVVLRPGEPAARQHDPYAPGLHHLCLRVETPEDVGNAAAELRALGVRASEPRVYPEYAPDYVATFFEDPDGIRWEITNFRQERRTRMSAWNEQR